MRMTYEEWLEKRETERLVTQYLEKKRQQEFSEEQRKESVLTRELESIVDVDSV